MDKQSVVTATVRYDRETFMRFQRFALRRTKWSMPILLGISVFVGILLEITPGVEQKPRHFTDVLPLLVVELFIAAYLILVPRIAYKKAKGLYDGEMVFAFFDDHLAHSQSGGTASGTGECGYDVFRCVYETRYAFYLQLKNSTTFIIAKKYLTPEQTARLGDFLRLKFGGAYRRHR